jgi:hypothetical protein
VDKLANAVKSNPGAQGEKCRSGKVLRRPHHTKDGVTVAKELELEDKFENMGAQWCAGLLPKRPIRRRRHDDGDHTGPGHLSRRGETGGGWRESHGA